MVPKLRRKYPEAISMRQAAEILGVHPRTIRRWIRRRIIPAYRIGPQLVRIPRSAIAKLRAIRIELAIPDTDRLETPEPPATTPATTP